MPINSKYSDKHIEDILNQLNMVLLKNKASPDLCLMLLGNLVTNIINQDIPASQRKEIAEKFAQVLTTSVN